MVKPFWELNGNSKRFEFLHHSVAGNKRNQNKWIIKSFFKILIKFDAQCFAAFYAYDMGGQLLLYDNITSPFTTLHFFILSLIS